MTLTRWFRRDATWKAGRASGPRAFSLGGLVILTVLLGIVTALVALPFQQTRERQMTSAARDQLPALFAAVEAYRAAHYRFPDTIEELETTGYSPPPSIVVCRFQHVADARNFDDHIEVVVHHRASARATAARYPRGAPYERALDEACAPSRTAEAR